MINNIRNSKNLLDQETDRVLGNDIDNDQKEDEPKIYRPLELGKIQFGLGAFPTFSYTQNKMFLVPIHGNPENRKFSSIDQAMEIVLNHIIKHHGQMKRALAHQYGDQVEVLDITKGHYVALGSIENRFFNQSYTRVSRRLTHLLEEQTFHNNEKNKKKANGRTRA